jgi:glutathione S-transferase
MNEMIVYGIPGSPYVRSALLGLEEKDAPYVFAPLGAGQHRTPEHLRLHPFGRVPVIDHDGFVMYETAAILRYVDALFPAPAFRPREARQAARADQLANIVDWYFFRNISVPITWERTMVLRFGGVPNEEKIAAALPGARICVNEIERLRGDSEFLVGDAVSIADLMLAPQLDYFAATAEGREILDGTRLAAWLERMRSRPSMRATAWERLKKAA